MDSNQIVEILNAKLHEITENPQLGLIKNPNQETIDSNKKLGDIWKRTLSMSHADYMKGIGRGIEQHGYRSKEDMVMKGINSQHDADPEADEANKQKMKKALKDKSLAPALSNMNNR